MLFKIISDAINAECHVKEHMNYWSKDVESIFNISLSHLVLTFHFHI